MEIFEKTEIWVEQAHKKGKIPKSFKVTEENYRFYYGIMINMQFFAWKEWFDLAQELNEKANTLGWISGNSNPYKNKLLFIRKNKEFFGTEYSSFVPLILSVHGLIEKITKVEFSKMNIIITFIADKSK